MPDKDILQNEFRELQRSIQKEYLPDDVVVNLKFKHDDYDSEQTGPVEINDKEYRNRVFDIKFYKPIEKEYGCRKEIMLRHEFIHIADMINPAFCYISNADIKNSNTKEIFINALVRQYLWEISIVMRLKKKSNLDDPVTIDGRRENFLCRYNGVYKPSCDKKEMLINMVNPIEQLVGKNMLCWDAMKKVAESKIA